MATLGASSRLLRHGPSRIPRRHGGGASCRAARRPRRRKQGKRIGWVSWGMSRLPTPEALDCGASSHRDSKTSATSPRRGIQILRPPLPPLLDRIRVLWIVPVRIEVEAMAEAGIAAELIVGNAFDELEQPVVNVLLVPEHLTQR